MFTHVNVHTFLKLSLSLLFSLETRIVSRNKGSKNSSSWMMLSPGFLWLKPRRTLLARPRSELWLLSPCDSRESKRMPLRCRRDGGWCCGQEDFKSHYQSEEEKVGSIELRTEECVSSLRDKTATELCGEAEPEAFCGFLKSLHGDSPVPSSWNRASP